MGKRVRFPEWVYLQLVAFELTFLKVYRHHVGDYMHRWLVEHLWGFVRLHHIRRSDADRDMHDHPFDFTSFLLTGGYTEFTPDHPDGVWHPALSVVRKRAEDLHRLELDSPVWTLVFAGRKRRQWGFMTPTGWVDWEHYYSLKEGGKDEDGEAHPIPMRLACPNCGHWHVDGPEPAKGWTNPPHRSHLCHKCGFVWRPADVPTEGVLWLKTSGKNDGKLTRFGRVAPAHE